MILSAQTIRRRGIVSPFCERTLYQGVSYGLSSHGYDVRIAESLELRPGDFVLASTIERFDMPQDIAATVHDKSTWVRKGLCAQTTVIEAGWRGHLTLELTMHGPGKLFIPAGVGIAQILFHRLDEPTERLYRGKYQDQRAGPQPAIFETER